MAVYTDSLIDHYLDYLMYRQNQKKISCVVNLLNTKLIWKVKGISIYQPQLEFVILNGSVNRKTKNKPFTTEWKSDTYN